MTCPFKIRLFTNVFPVPNNLHESTLFHLQGWKLRYACAGPALSQRLKDSHQSKKKFTNLVSGRLWTTQADINWYVYAWLAAAAAITSLFNSTLAAFKSKFLVKMLSYLKQFWWFHSSAIFFLQQLNRLYKLKLQKH